MPPSNVTLPVVSTPAHLVKKITGPGLVRRVLPARIDHPHRHALKPVDRTGIHIHVHEKRGVRGKPGQIGGSPGDGRRTGPGKGGPGLDGQDAAQAQALTRDVDADASKPPLP